MFEYYSHIHVYSPGAEADNPLGPKCFCKHKYSIHLPISCKFCPSTHILTNFPIRMHGRPMLTLQLIRSRSSEGHGLIYTNFVELHCLMLHAKFQNHRPSGSGEKVQVGKDQEKAQSEKRFPLQKPRWEKTKLTIRYLYHETYRKPNEQLFSQ